MRFRFETLLRLRKNQENLIQKTLGTLQGHLARQERNLGIMEGARQDSARQLADRLGQPVTAHTLVLYDRFFESIKAHKQKQAEVISEVTERAGAKRRELMEAVRKRRTLDILKERELLEWKRKKQKQETALLDEIGSAQWFMRQR